MHSGRRLLATLEGYAVEGGFDGPGEPATCYGPAGRLGQLALPGAAEGLWRHYEAVMDAAAPLGLDGVRVTLEWARLEPKPDQVDAAAFSRYRAALRHARSLGWTVTGVLIDAAWPAWLGPEAWLLPWVGPRVLTHAARVADELGGELTGLVAFARPDQLVRDGYRTGGSPPWRSHAERDAVSANRQIQCVRDELAASPVGPLLVSSFVEIPALPDTVAMRAVLASTPSAAEIHVRSLLAGTGPTRCAHGLLTRTADGWRADSRVLDALNQS